MALTLTFNQDLLPPGGTDQGRTDIYSDIGAAGRANVVEIAVGGIPATSSIELVLLDEPPLSNPLLTQLTPDAWTLAFDLDCWGPFRVRCNAVVGGLVVDSVTRRISIRSPGYALQYPALAERTDPNAQFVATIPSIALTEMNEGATNRPVVDFHREVVETLEAIGAGGVGTIPDGAITEAKLDPAFVAALVLTDGTHAMVADLQLGGHAIKNLGAPVASSDAARLQDVLDTQAVAGAGMTQVGPELNVIANADGSIVVHDNDVQVGQLATDVQHGVRGGGGQHSPVTTDTNGFMTYPDKVKLNTVTAGADPTIATLAAATAAIGVNGQRITGLGTPTATNDATTKAYVDARPPAAHSSSHADGGSDELVVAGLSGVLADPQLAGSIKTATGAVAVAAAAAPSIGQVLTAQSATAGSWQTPTQLTSSAPSQVSVTTAAQGSGTTAARDDHVHSVLANVSPQQLQAGASAAVGTSTALARADHVHAVSVGTPIALPVGGSNAGGSASSLARSDHTHALPSFGAVAGTFTQGNDARLSDDRTASGLRDATGIVVVSAAAAPSTGQVLTATGPTAGNWQTPTALASAAPTQVSDVAAAVGVGTSSARADHVHSVATGTPTALTVGGSNAAGSATSLARSDHVHATPAAGTPSALTLAGTNAQGSAATVALSDHVHALPATAAAVALTPGGANAVGTAITLARSDHTHALPSFGAVAGTFTQGNDARLSDDRTASGLRDATGIVVVSAAAAPSTGQVLTATGPTAGNWQTPTALASAAPTQVSDVAAAVGVGTSSARADHVHSVATGTPAALTVGGSNAAGSATSLARSDHTHAMPATATTAAAGFLSAADKTRIDGMATSAAALTSTAPVALPGAAAVGVATVAARGDHAHPTDFKPLCRVLAALGSLTPSAAPLIVDGVTLAANDRVLALVTNSAGSSGIWTVTTPGTGADGVWTKIGSNVSVGAIVGIKEGAAYAGSLWVARAGGELFKPIESSWRRSVRAFFSPFSQDFNAAPLVVDGITLANGDTVLVQYGANPNGTSGVYRVESAGTGADGVWTIVAQTMQLGDMLLVREGTTYGGTLRKSTGTGTSAGSPTTPAVTDAFHGALGGAALHAIATTAAAGFLSAADKTTIDFVASNRTKNVCDAVYTTPLTLSGVVDVSAGMRVLVAGQADAKTNGIYLSAAGAWTRAEDANSSADFSRAMLVPVLRYTEGADELRFYTLNVETPITLGTTNLVFTEEKGAAWLFYSISNAQAPISVGGQRVTTLGTPTATTDATTKAYVDSVAGGTLATLLAQMPRVNQCRLTGDPASSVMLADNATISTLYFLPHVGDVIWCYVTANTAWLPFRIPVAGISLALSGLTVGRPYDVFVVSPASSAGTPTLELLAWTSTTARATALVNQGGFYTKTGDLTRRYVGTIYARAANSLAFFTSGYTTTTAKCDIWNADNRVTAVFGANTAWTGSITTATANTWFYASAGYKLEFITGLRADPLQAHYDVGVGTNGTGNMGFCGIGLNASPSSGARAINAAGESSLALACLNDIPPIGANILNYMLSGSSTAVVFYSTDDPAGAIPVYSHNCFCRYQC